MSSSECPFRPFLFRYLPLGLYKELHCRKSVDHVITSASIEDPLVDHMLGEGKSSSRPPFHNWSE